MLFEVMKKSQPHKDRLLEKKEPLRLLEKTGAYQTWRCSGLGR
jgi:hypothetical protein